MHNNRLDEYLNDLEGRLRLAPALKEAELREVRGHLEALVASHITEGHDGETATRLALEQFGKAAQLGGDLNRVARRKQFAKSARWIGKGFLNWCFLFGGNFGFYSLMNDKPTDFPFSLHDRLWLSIIIMTPAFFAGQIGGDLLEKSVKKWKARRVAK